MHRCVSTPAGMPLSTHFWVHVAMSAGAYNTGIPVCIYGGCEGTRWVFRCEGLGVPGCAYQASSRGGRSYSSGASLMLGGVLCPREGTQH